MCYCTIKAYYITTKRHEYVTHLLQYFQCSKLHTSTQDTIYQSTVIPLEVCCSPTVMLIHSVLCIWCQTFTCLNFAFTVTFSALHLANTSIQAKYLKTVFICRFASNNRCHYRAGEFTAIALFNHCLSLIAYDYIEQYCNSGNNSSGTVTYVCLL